LLTILYCILGVNRFIIIISGINHERNEKFEDK